MLCRMGSVQSMGVLSAIDANMDSEKLARDMIFFLSDSQTKDASGTRTLVPDPLHPNLKHNPTQTKDLSLIPYM